MNVELPFLDVLLQQIVSTKTTKDHHLLAMNVFVKMATKEMALIVKVCTFRSIIITSAVYYIDILQCWFFVFFEILDIDECTELSLDGLPLHNCPVSSVCVDDVGNYSCLCNQGFLQQVDIHQVTTCTGTHILSKSSIIVGEPEVFLLLCRSSKV